MRVRVAERVLGDIRYAKAALISGPKQYGTRQKIRWNLAIRGRLALTSVGHQLPDFPAVLSFLGKYPRMTERIKGTATISICRDLDVASDDDIEVYGLALMLVLCDQSVEDAL